MVVAVVFCTCWVVVVAVLVCDSMPNAQVQCNAMSFVFVNVEQSFAMA